MHTSDLKDEAYWDTSKDMEAEGPVQNPFMTPAGAAGTATATTTAAIAAAAAIATRAASTDMATPVDETMENDGVSDDEDVDSDGDTDETEAEMDRLVVDLATNPNNESIRERLVELGIRIEDFVFHRRTKRYVTTYRRTLSDLPKQLPFVRTGRTERIVVFVFSLYVSASFLSRLTGSAATR